METVTVAEARKNFSELMAQVAYARKRVLVERRGKPMMALVSIEDLERLEALEDDKETIRKRRLAALEMAAAVRKRISLERNGVPLPDSAEELNRLREERVHELSGLR